MNQLSRGDNHRRLPNSRRIGWNRWPLFAGPHPFGPHELDCAAAFTAALAGGAPGGGDGAGEASAGGLGEAASTPGFTSATCVGFSKTVADTTGLVSATASGPACAGKLGSGLAAYAKHTAARTGRMFFMDHALE